METRNNNAQDQNQEKMNLDSNDRGVDDPGLNQDGTHDIKDDENFDESDDFHKYDDVDHSNVDPSDPIAQSNEKMNKNSENERPTFNRTYDKNAPDDDSIDTAGRFDGTIGI